MCVGKRWKREKRGVKCVRKQKKQVQFVHRNGDPCDRNEKKFIRKKKGEKCAGKMKKVSGPHHPQMIKAYQPMVQHPLPPAPDRYPPPPKKIVKYLFSLPSVLSSITNISGKSDVLPDDATRENPCWIFV